jgi:tetratricopeptide (TPR) repeat protein
LDIGKNPKLMMTLLLIVMIVGSFFSILWPTLYTTMQNQSVIPSLQPKEKLTDDEKDAFYLTNIKKAKENKLGDNMIPKTIRAYANWLFFNSQDWEKAKKYYLECAESCGGKGIDGHARTIQADAILDALDCDHRLYIAGKGSPPTEQTAVAARQEQVDAARAMGWTNDANDVWRTQDSLAKVSEVFCDNGKFSEGAKYIEESLTSLKAQKHDEYNLAYRMVQKARALAGMGRTDESDRLFREAVSMNDKVNGGGSASEENLIRLYASCLIRDGQTERGERIRQMQDYLVSN